MAKPQIVWLRRDLRLVDQAAFHAAAELGPVIPVYVLDDETPGDRRMGAACRWWLHHSLAALAAVLRRKLLPRMDAARAQMEAGGSSAVTAFRRMHVAAIGVNLVQLVLITWSLITVSMG